MFERRGQLALFLILGMVVLWAFVFLVAAPRLVSQQDAFPCDGIEAHVELQVGASLDDCLTRVGLGGGEAGSERGYAFDGHRILRAYDGAPGFLDEAQLTKNLESCVERTANACLDSLEVFRDRGCPVSWDHAVPEAVLAREGVALSVFLNLTTGDRRWSRAAPEDRDVRLSLWHARIANLTERRDLQVQPGDFHLDALSRWDAGVTIVQVGPNEQVTHILDNRSRLDDAPYSFVFADRFVPPVPGQGS